MSSPTPRPVTHSLRFRSHLRLHVLRAVALVLSTSLATACAEPPTSVDGPVVNAPVTVSASLTAEEQSLIKGLSVTVTGPGITVPIVANLDVTGSTVNGTVLVPTGANRIFAVKAFDIAGLETYNGTATATISPGTNATIPITLFAATGNAPITVTVATYTIDISPASVSLAGGATTLLTATVRDANNIAIDASSDLQWGSSNPVIAALSARSGATVTLTGGVAGSATIVASYRGIAVALPVTVTGSAANVRGQSGDGTTTFRLPPTLVVFP